MRLLLILLLACGTPDELVESTTHRVVSSDAGTPASPHNISSTSASPWCAPEAWKVSGPGARSMVEKLTAARCRTT